ncbi:patatin-like phospholipase family protein [Polynucleobacter sp. JS-Safj-400b-B2]|uniref:patatin-like phospholipase family protein n=1 Tax=Polynucleobacter sp. JS-Safj-400b-B2 TaxID=2576921 RepID=UPI001C0B27C9|nr:patatin-like phospholipase family protein [Polynucleobacter sp. JS-Safj-400b-B2]MBU3627255.1 patatin-like phospholipase family protein [Polynucleobacter sp. JS-Safj-400b-B2]
MSPSDISRANVRSKCLLLSMAFLLLTMLGCASRPINPPMDKIDLETGYRGLSHTRGQNKNNKLPENLVVLAFSGGGTRAAAFSYGVLEALREMELQESSGKKVRALDQVNLITGVSGGSFTALSYGLYGEKLFDFYDTDFLKRDVQGEIIARAANPFNWTRLSSTGWGRSELAAELYDEILFHGATYADLKKNNGPYILASGTDISSGGGFTFDQSFFDYLCSDLLGVPLSRAAASSSAVPFVLSSVTYNNYAGRCKFIEPDYLARFENSANAPRPAARLIKEMNDLKLYHDQKDNPYIHVVDGGVADNLAMRQMLNFLEGLEAMHLSGKATQFDNVKRIIVVVVNALSSPKTTWNESIDGPGAIELLIKAAGVPIDHYSYEEVETLKDTQARWNSMRTLRDSRLFKSNQNPELAKIINTPNIDLYALNVAFNMLEDKAEFEYLNNLPTSFVLPPEAVDRLRAAAKKIIFDSPEVKKVMTSYGSKIISK